MIVNTFYSFFRKTFNISFFKILQFLRETKIVKIVYREKYNKSSGILFFIISIYENDERNIKQKFFRRKNKANTEESLY